MGVKLTNEEVDRRLAKYGVLRLSEYKGKDIKIRAKCSCGNIWYVLPANAFKGGRCPRCSYQRQRETKRSKYGNKIVEEHDDWVRIDISTPEHPNCYTDLDRDFWELYKSSNLGRIYAWKGRDTSSYIYAGTTDLDTKDTILLHKIILPVEDCMLVDHKTHGTMNYIDNRRANLRPVTYSQNSINTKKRSKSGITGVYFHDGSRVWQSYITINHHRINLGWFAEDDLEGAITARKKAEELYFGEYAYDANNEC